MALTGVHRRAHTRGAKQTPPLAALVGSTPGRLLRQPVMAVSGVGGSDRVVCAGGGVRPRLALSLMERVCKAHLECAPLSCVWPRGRVREWSERHCAFLTPL